MKNLKNFIAVTIILSQFFWSISGYANPIGGIVAPGSGAATIGTAGNTLTVTQTTPKVVINWQGFSIAAGETTNFVQPSSTSVALNRVTGTSPSDIYGNLNANGTVFLINQNGILFSSTAQVNVGGLVASTLDITDSQFQIAQYPTTAFGQPISQHGYYFIGASGFGSVVNNGTININAPGGFAALIGSNVENTGSIVTQAGTVVLASGDAIAINLDATGNVSAVVVPQGLTDNSATNINAVLNSGTLTANGGEVILTAQSLKGLFTNLVNNTGIIEANGIIIGANDHVVLTGALTAGTGNILSSGIGGISITAGDIDIDYATITSTALNDKALINIQYNGGINIVNSTLLATSSMTVGPPTSFAGIYIQGNGVANIVNSQLRAVLNSTIAGSATINGLMTNGTDLDITSSLNSAGESGVILNNSQLESSVNGASSESTSFITAQTNSNPLNGNIQFINGSSMVNNQAGSGYQNLIISGENITSDSTSLVTADTLYLTAVGNIGGTTLLPFNTDVGTIYAASTGIGLINIKNIDTAAAGLNLSDVTTADGRITVNADGNINVTTVNAGGSKVFLKSTAGSILDANSSITGNVVSLTGVDGVGTGTNAINTTANTLDASAADGLVNINQTGDVALGSVTTGGGSANSITVKGSGNIDVGTISASGGSADVNLNAAAGITDNTGGTITANNLSLVANNSIGSSVHRVNVNVNNLSANSQIIGDVYMNSINSITLTDLITNNGLIDVTSDGQVTAENITTGGGANDSISLATTFGDIDLGNINAAGGLADVTLNSAGNIYAINANNLITANNLNLSAGIIGSSVGQQLLLATANLSTSVVGGYQELTIKNQPGAASYDIYFVAYNNLLQPIGTWQMEANVPASTGSSTVWMDLNRPSILNGVASYYVVVNTAATSNIGSSASPVNTHVNTISGISKDIGDIYLDQGKSVAISNLQTTNGLINVSSTGDMSIGNINAAGNVFLNSVNGSIVGTGGGTNVTSTGDTHLTAGNLIGNWDPYAPLTINVGGDLYLAIGQRAASATGSVGTMGVSGTLSGTVGGAYHFAPGTYAPYNSVNSVFNGNPPGYIFLNNNEIWPNLGLDLTPTALNNNDTLIDSQISNSIQPNQAVTYENQRRHLIRKESNVAPYTSYAYHATLNNNRSAIDNVRVAPEAYDYIGARINLSAPAAPVIQVQNQK